MKAGDFILETVEASTVFFSFIECNPGNNFKIIKFRVDFLEKVYYY